ncbi:acyclic terpene utilization AtuA family protein [Saccharopolyspora sp. ID03-671]
MARPIRIAGFSGYLGDRRSALDEAMAGDPVDVLIGDYLAEFTLAMLSARHRSDPSRGYVEYFLTQLEPHLSAIAERGVRVVVNAGGFNPAGLAEATRALVAEAGADLRVAHVEGDNVLPRLAELQAGGHDLASMDTGEPLESWRGSPVAANAYLGGWGITAALRAGADIVVCGRVTDASLTAGPAAWWHEWSRTDFDRLAASVVAGHIIECGPHATGGNFSGFTAIPGAVAPGFPIAEIADDGTTVITKHAADGGAVTTDTVTAQLVYEIQGPRYLNPDVTAHLDDLRLRQIGPDRVELSGATGSPPPPTTKVALFAPIGHQIVTALYVTGLDIDAKVALIREQAEALLAGAEAELDVSALGTVAEDPQRQWDATAQVRIMATASEREPLQRLVSGIGELPVQRSGVLHRHRGPAGGDAQHPRRLLAGAARHGRRRAHRGARRRDPDRRGTARDDGRVVPARASRTARARIGRHAAGAAGASRARPVRRQGRQQQRRAVGVGSGGLAVVAEPAHHRGAAQADARGQGPGDRPPRVPEPARRALRAAGTARDRRVQQPARGPDRQGRRGVPARAARRRPGGVAVIRAGNAMASGCERALICVHRTQ